jgi:hypothetical protein
MQRAALSAGMPPPYLLDPYTNASPHSNINTQRKDIMNIKHITTFKTVHTTIPASTPYFGIKPKKTTRPGT